MIPTILLTQIGSFSIDDGDGSKNVTFKRIRVFSNFVAFKYSNSIKISNVGEFSGIDFLGTALKFRKKKKLPLPVYVLHKI